MLAVGSWNWVHGDAGIVLELDRSGPMDQALSKKHIASLEVRQRGGSDKDVYGSSDWTTVSYSPILCKEVARRFGSRIQMKQFAARRYVGNTLTIVLCSIQVVVFDKLLKEQMEFPTP